MAMPWEDEGSRRPIGYTEVPPLFDASMDGATPKVSAKIRDSPSAERGAPPHPPTPFGRGSLLLPQGEKVFAPMGECHSTG
jgi:hypothetical protein